MIYTPHSRVPASIDAAPAESAPAVSVPAESLSADPAAASLSEPYVALTNPATIARMLENARATRSPLTIKLKTATRLHIFETRIQLVDAVLGELVLHRLSPGDWRSVVPGPVAVDVSCQLPGGLFRFASTLAPLDAGTDNQYCLMTLPGLLYRYQLRNSFRVSVPRDSTLIALPRASQVISGQCINLSLEGSCVMFREDIAGSLNHDEVIENLIVKLKDSLQFRTTAVVCRLEVLRAGTLVGLRFHALPPALQRSLQAELTRLQREYLRRLVPYRHGGSD